MNSLNRSGIRGIVVQTVSLIIGLAILFISAGTLRWIRGWIYAGLVSIYWVVSTSVLARMNPEVLNARGSFAKEGTKGFERVWVVIYPALTFANLVIMGFDAARFRWSFMPFWLTFIGIFMFIAASLLVVWAMAVNRFFECTARIQRDRQHYVCTTGPYRIIRHQGYAGGIVSLLAYPFILGSWWGFVLSGILAIMLVARTALEDSMLQNELPGYTEYANQVRYRLAPLIW